MKEDKYMALTLKVLEIFCGDVYILITLAIIYGPSHSSNWD